MTDYGCTDAAMAFAAAVITLGVKRCKSQQRMQTLTLRPRLESATELNYYVKCLSAIKTKRQAKLVFQQF